MMKILITGGSGLLGSHLIKILKQKKIDYYAPTRTELNIENLNHCLYNINSLHKPDIVIHCAAIAKYRDVEDNPLTAVKTNVVGTCNILHACMVDNIRMIYISSDHVFDGQDGPYNINDKIQPVTRYAKTKAAGELVVQIYENSLIVRTSFCPEKFPFDAAYTDKWTSQDYVDKIAPKIIEKSLLDDTGICHIGHERRSFYELAKERNTNIQSGSVKQIQKTSKVPILIDTSLEIS